MKSFMLSVPLLFSPLLFSSLPSNFCLLMSTGTTHVRVNMDTVTKWLFILCVLVFLVYKYGTRNYRYWSKRGVQQLKPLPFVGNNIFGIAKKQNPLEIMWMVYSPFKESGFGGVYIGQKAFLCITDPHLLKQVMVKDADFFFNRHEWFRNNDPLMEKNLINLKDDTWRNMRTVMTTVFTSAKMKDMFGFMDRCAAQGVEYLKQKGAEQRKSGNSGQEIDCKEFFSRYGTDVIASTAFGLEVDSFKNPENEFYSSGFAIRNSLRGFGLIKFMLMFTFPGLTKKLGWTFLGKKYNDFFTSLIEETIRHREKNNIVRKDVIHILMEARKGKGVNEDGELIKGKLPDLTDLDIAAQGLVFFFGGFETIATLLGFVTYELAVNPDIQEKLQQEIDEVIENNNGITYDGIMHQMEYLNMVINETLRKWPPASLSDRDVSKTYTIPKTPNSPEVVLTRGDKIIVPIGGLHYDPEYFPDPQRFDPERFRDEKNTIKPFTYLPFGEGPRHCIGKRYALMEAKTVLVHLLKTFTLVPGAKTEVPLKLANKGAFALEPVKGFWLELKARN